MTAPRRRLALDLGEALAAQAVDREQVRARLLDDQARDLIRPHLYDVPGAWLRLRWTVENDRTGEVLAEGRARSRRAAERRRYRAYKRELARYAGGAA